jgi:hypothetical protein
MTSSINAAEWLDVFAIAPRERVWYLAIIIKTAPARNRMHGRSLISNVDIATWWRVDGALHREVGARIGGRHALTLLQAHEFCASRQIR